MTDSFTVAAFGGNNHARPWIEQTESIERVQRHHRQPFPPQANETLGKLPRRRGEFRTTFQLSARATDPDGDALTYSWSILNAGNAVVTTLAAGADVPFSHHAFCVPPSLVSRSRTRKRAFSLPARQFRLRRGFRFDRDVCACRRSADIANCSHPAHNSVACTEVNTRDAFYLGLTRSRLSAVHVGCWNSRQNRDNASYLVAYMLPCPSRAMRRGLSDQPLRGTSCPPPRHLRGTWLPSAALLALFGTELLILSIAFDTSPLDALSSAPARLVAGSPQVVRLALAVGIAVLFVGSLRGADWLRTARKPVTRRRLASLAVHAGAIAAFTWVTALLLEGNIAALPHRTAWTIAWLASGAAAIVSWAVALFPAITWRDEAHAHRRHLVAGVLSGVVIWAAGYATQEFWRPMARVTFGAVVWLLELVYEPTVVEPTSLRVGTPQFSVVISPSCSGYEGIGLVVAFLSIYLWLFRRELRFPAALLLLPIGAATIWFVNALRIVLLIAIGTSGWPAVALGGFHSQAGWIAFSLISLGLVVLALRSRWFAVEVSSDGPQLADPTFARLAPFAAVTATAMLTGAFAAGIDWLYPLRIVAAGVVLWVFRRHYAALVRSWTWSWWPLLLGAITFAAWIALSPPAGSTAGGWAGVVGTEPLLWVALWATFRVVGYVLVTPVVEELAFRAFLVQRLEQSPIGRFSWAALLISSVLFGALHGQMWIAGILAGAVFAIAFYRRRMIADAVMAHGVTNALLVVYASTTGQWAVWS